MRTYGFIELNNDRNRWVIQKMEPHVSIRLKQLFPSVPKQSVPPYQLPHTDQADADLEWFMQRYPLSIGEDDRSELVRGRDAFLNQQSEMERILLPTFTPGPQPTLKAGHLLRPYQVQAIEILRKRKSLLLGDEVGLGKTYTAAGFVVSEPNSIPVAVVCDPHMQRQWKEKLEDFTHLRVHLIKKSKPYDLPKADVYVFRISQVSGWSDIFATGFFKSAIYDEPQSLRTGTGTAKGEACYVLSKHTEYRLGLSATPIYNYGDEMWHIMQFIDRNVLSQWDDFSREWCTPIGNGKYRICNPAALGTYLREQYAMVRRLRSDIGQQLPKVSRIVEHIDYNEAEVARVEDMARMLAIKATSASFVERGQAARELDIMMRQVTGVAKAVTVAKFARMIVEAGEPVVIWGWHREVYDIWMRELSDLSPAMYTGSESAKQKDDVKARFLRGETDILIMSLRSGAGVDGLQHRCSTGIFGELDWSPGIHHQCGGRLDREGQTNPVTLFFLVTDDGSDPPMMDVLGIKSSESRGIVDPSLGVTVVENDASHLRKLVERYLDRKSSHGGLVEVGASGNGHLFN